MRFMKQAGRFGFIAMVAVSSLGSQLAIADEDDDILLKAIHKYDITKCDSFVLKHGKLKGNWHMNTSRSPGLSTNDFREMAITQVFGKKGDSVKITQSYIQTPSACYVLDITTVTFPGSCNDRDNIDQDLWFVKDEMDGLDYKKYENKGGVIMYAKEISVGNFKACVIEYQSRYSSKINK